MIHRRWRTIETRTVVSNPRLTVDMETVELPDGRTVPDFYRVRMPDFALVFAMTEDDRVLVLRSYRHGPRRVCLTFPGGAIGSGESPEDAVRRELLEETGYEANTWESLGAYVTNANQGCNTAHLFRAAGCRRVAEPHAGDLEEMELLLIPRAELLTRSCLAEIGLASHVALLFVATHPQLML